MAWFILARLLFTVAVAYTAYQLHPVGADPLVNVLFGLSLAGIAVLFEWLLRDLALTTLIGAVIGGCVGLALATIPNRSRFSTASSCCCSRTWDCSSARARANGSSRRG
jgi:hypothetical protein